MAEKLKSIAEVEKLKGQNKYSSALEMAQTLLKTNPSSSQIHSLMAELFVLNKMYEPALSFYNRLNEATQAEGKSTDLPVALGIARCYVMLSKTEEAKNVLNQVTAKLPKHPEVLTLLSIIARKMKQFDEAERLAREVLKSNPDHKEAKYELADALVRKKDDEAALKLLEANIRRKDFHGDSIDLWLSILFRNDRNRYAQDIMEELVTKYPDSVEFNFGLAVLANRAGETTIARPAFEKALQLSPNNSKIIYELAVLERIAGNLTQSQQLLEQALTIRPDNPAALRTFGSDLKYTYGDSNFAKLNFAAAKFTDYNASEQLHLHYALAKAFEDVEELDIAFRHYEIAGAKKRKADIFNEKEASRLTQIIPKVVTKANLEKTNLKGFESEVPVFILGMPRSGTSLMEQILSSHPDVFGAGELKFMTGALENIPVAAMRLRMGEKDPVFDYDLKAGWAERGQKYVERITKLADAPHKRIVDKMPGNFNFVGLIHAILPNARIIHSRRHPVETCLSCYRIYFAEGHQWTYNLRELGRYYKRYWNLMKYWREEFPGVMHEIRYEDNVANIESQARQLIDYLGLEWNENCLNFYNTDRPVKTASVTQVRKPIYTTSTNRWRKYEKYLGPLLEELGDIVPEYESEIEHLKH